MIVWIMKKGYISNWQYWSLVILIYSNQVAFGIIENTRSISFPVIKEYFHVGYDTYGYFTSCLTIAIIVCCVCSSLASERVSYKTIICFGYSFIVIGCALTQFAKNFLFTAICMVIVWMGFGCFEIGANALSTLVFVENKGTMMSLMHFFFGIGSIVGPNIARFCLRSMTNGFYSIYACVTIIIACFFILALCLPFKLPSVSHDGNTKVPTMTVASSLKTPSVWLLALVLGLGNVIEVSGATWAPLYLVDILGFDIDKEVPNFTTALYIIFTISRLVSGPIIDRIGYYRSLYICFFGVFILLFIGFYLGRNGVVFFILAGFFYSANWPITICIIMGYFKKNAPVVTSVVIILQSVVTLPVNSILGLLNEYLGKQSAYHMTEVFCLCGAGLLTVVYYSQKKYELVVAK